MSVRSLALDYAGMADLDLGKDYGTVSVTDLVGYYIENPPAPKSASAQAEAPHRFGGC